MHDTLLYHMVAAFDDLHDSELRPEMEREFRRVEDLFHYEPGSVMDAYGRQQ